jgi:hypothetical protein
MVSEAFCFNHLKTDIHLNYMNKPLLIQKKKKNSVQYGHRQVNVLYGNNHCLLMASHATHKFGGKIQTSECCGSWSRYLPLNFKLCILTACVQFAARTATLPFPPLISSLSRKFGCNVFTFFDFKQNWFIHSEYRVNIIWQASLKEGNFPGQLRDYQLLTGSTAARSFVVCSLLNR